MKIFITGGNSDAGVALAEKLIPQGHTVVAYDLNGNQLPGEVQFIEGDVRDFPRVVNAAGSCNAGIHLASLAGESKDEDILSVNVLGAYGFLRAAQRAQFQSAVIASSAPVHLSPSALDDGFLLRTSDGGDHVYDLTKTLQEVIGRDFHSHGLPVCCVRFGHIVRGAEEVNLERSRPLSSEDYCRGGWVALEDVADACVAALTLDPPGEVFEILNIVGARDGRTRFRVADAEERLGIELQYDFAAFE